jgi:alpha-D-ribose 1-methylphosphonate 5-triphosphate diphosphatase
MQVPMAAVRIVNARMPLHGEIVESELVIEAGAIAAVGCGGGGAADWDVDGRLVLPGIVDLHGDAFERQLMPRPGVFFPDDVALAETDRQLAANGITTAFHALTWSWEPGLRGPERARAFVAAIDRLRPSLACDSRLHLRWETFALAEFDEVDDLVTSGRVDLLAFNDHTTGMVAHARGPEAIDRYADRAGVSTDEYVRLLAAAWARRHDVPWAVARIAESARVAGIPVASHDDETPAERAFYRGLGARACEFPKTRETAEFARAGGDQVLMGAPNVVRGGSHLNLVSAARLVADRLCDVLTSDYFYPALALAPFRLAQDGSLPLVEAWRLVSENPAAVARLADRGRIAPGLRADLVVVDDSDPLAPRVTATLVAGRLVHFRGFRDALPAGPLAGGHGSVNAESSLAG